MAINALNSALYNTNYLFGTQSKQQDSIAKLWNNYNSMQSNATNSLAGINEVNANLKSLLDSYDAAKSTFNSEFGENMEALSKSAEGVAGYNFHVETEGAITTSTTTDKDGKTSTVTTYSKELQAALKTVEDFIGDYNSSIDFFKDNSSVSKRVENLARVFGDTTFRSNAYATIGLVTNSDGSISIDETQLAQSIVNNPEKVSSVLGSDGLAGKAQAHIDFANSQAEKLFPSAESMLGDQLKTASVYTGKAFLNMTAYTNAGNLLNMMF